MWIESSKWSLATLWATDILAIGNGISFVNDLLGSDSSPKWVRVILEKILEALRIQLNLELTFKDVMFSREDAPTWLFWAPVLTSYGLGMTSFTFLAVPKLRSGPCSPFRGGEIGNIS